MTPDQRAGSGEDRAYIDANTRERDRLRALVERLDDDALTAPVNEYWTVAGVLGHMAYWDIRVLVLAEKIDSGEPWALGDAEPDGDWLNDSTRPLIHAIAPREAARLAVRIAEQTDTLVAKLPLDRLWPRDPTSPIFAGRGEHRGEHLDEIEAALTQRSRGAVMNEESVVAWIISAFDRVEHLVKDGTTFFSFDPEHMHPFATLVTNNLNDSASELDRPGVYRLNVGVRKETWVGLFGQPTKGTPGDYGLGSGSAADWDFKALDTLMPHPVYGRMHWVCVLNPSDATFEKVKPLLAEAYEIDVARTKQKQSRKATSSTEV